MFLTFKLFARWLMLPQSKPTAGSGTFFLHKSLCYIIKITNVRFPLFTVFETFRLIFTLLGMQFCLYETIFQKIKHFITLKNAVTTTLMPEQNTEVLQTISY